MIRLEVGEPSFTTPAHVIEAAARAARGGHTGYGPNGGLPSLRELLSEKLRRVNGIEASPEEIVVTPGAMNALYSVYLALLEPGDEVLLPTPGFPNMDEMVRLLGGRPVFYPLAADEGFLPDVAALDGLVTARTRMLFVNTPANPTGAVYPARLMEELVEFAARHDLWLLCDEGVRRDGAVAGLRPHRGCALRCRRAGDHGVQLLEGVRHDRLACRLRGRTGQRRRAASHPAGTPGVVPEHDLPEGGRGGADRPPGPVRRHAGGLSPPAGRGAGGGGGGGPARCRPRRDPVHAGGCVRCGGSTISILRWACSARTR